MASKTTLTVKSLKTLGARPLAELLMEISKGDAAIKRRLRLALAAKEGPQELAHQVRKRLREIARSGSYVDSTRRKALVADLDNQRQAIVGDIANGSPADALELMWQFLGLAGSVYERCDDSSGVLGDLFASAREQIGNIAEAAAPDPSSLADRVFLALQDNGYGEYDGLIGELAPAMGAEGLDHLKSLFFDLSLEQPTTQSRGSWHELTVRIALQDIADAQGDVDGFIAQQSERGATMPGVAAEIAMRLLAAGRAQEALFALDAVKLDGPRSISTQWESARVSVLEALGQPEEAQLVRWSAFERSLNAEFLRDHLKQLPDFDDVEAEGRALDTVLEHDNVHSALHFLVSWPALDRAAQLVVARFEAIDGNFYELLSPAADMLEMKYPLAATLLHRAQVDFTLNKGRATRYQHAARHLAQCEYLASSLLDFDRFPTHASYLANLRSAHARKSSFWLII
jgi:hypothetical protein